MSRIYPAGTVVCLASNPDVPMTVVSTAAVITSSNVMWLDKEGKPHTATLQDNALQLYKKEK